jgi:tetratricopeptide (TPR) repeat protein
MAGVGRLADALKLADQALAADPADAQCLALKAALLNETGRPLEALPLFARALALDPRNASAHSNQGNTLARLGRPADAIASYDRALTLSPDHVMALCNRAGQKLALGHPEGALADAERAVSLKPDFAAAHRQKSAALAMLGQLSPALDAIDQALAIDGLNADSHERRSRILAALGHQGEAVEAQDRANEVNPGRAARLNARSMERLRKGNYREGWIDYEQRWRAPVFVANSTLYAGHPILQRLDLTVQTSQLVGRSVLLVDEQGLGDQIMFASILPDLLALGTKVTCLCDPRLLGLLRQSFPQIVFHPGGGSIPVDDDAFDAVLGLCSLGRLFRNDAADFPRKPYLRPGEEVARAWRERLGPKVRRLRLGLVWRGGLGKTRGEERSVALDALRPLLRRPDCEFVSLQHGDVSAEIDAANAGVAQPIQAFKAAEIHDFEQMAGLIQGLDLVVSVQTTVIHLAGALGVPCLVMVPASPEWRYGERGATMAWYGSTRLFRQPSPGAWRPVIEAVLTDISRRSALSGGR